MDIWSLPTRDLQLAAHELNERMNGKTVTYVINRNANFTNICNVGCAFCGFQRKTSEADAYTHSAQTIVERLETTPWVTEVCLQGGINPALDFDYYVELVQSIKTRYPEIHIHAYSPMEIEAMHRSSGLSYDTVLNTLLDAGLNSIPGTAAEILVDEVRQQISGNKLSSATWEKIVRCAHSLGIRSTSTIMYGHIETWAQIQCHFEILKNIQLDTGGFTEFVPLAFIPYKNRLGRVMNRTAEATESDFKQFEKRSLAMSQRLYSLSRLYFGDLIPNIQTSWVKLGTELAAESLNWGCNDFGGTLYEESITRESGGQHGEFLSSEKIEACIRAAGKIPQQRSTLYQPVRAVAETVL